jgi:hypothetical protein
MAINLKFILYKSLAIKVFISSFSFYLEIYDSFEHKGIYKKNILLNIKLKKLRLINKNL